jgi:hypothetical protein
LTVIQIYSYGGSKNGQDVVLDDEKCRDQSLATSSPRRRFITRAISTRSCSLATTSGTAPILTTSWASIPKRPPLGLRAARWSWEEAFASPYSIVMGQYGAYSFEDTRKKRGNNRVNPYPDYTGTIPERLSTSWTTSCSSGSNSRTKRPKDRV